ncbi:hypothetical protein E2320_012420 [Naja naja]|nr:hypothetical protein E2320_012420 [Naja naja]
MPGSTPSTPQGPGASRGIPRGAWRCPQKLPRGRGGGGGRGRKDLTSDDLRKVTSPRFNFLPTP